MNETEKTLVMARLDLAEARIRELEKKLKVTEAILMGHELKPIKPKT